jgi:NRPS condensation-like uncharacterized protein
VAVERIPFNLIDESFVNLDDPTQPVTVQMEVSFGTDLDEDRLSEAVHTALSLHPLARARLEPLASEATVPDWLIDPEPQVDPFRSISAVDDAEMDIARGDLQSQPLSLYESPPLRIRLGRHHGGDDVLMLSIHHAVCDGMGALRLLQSVARAYTGEPDPIPDIDPSVAHTLAIPETSSWTDHAKSLKVEARRMSRMGSRPARLSPEGAVNKAGYGILTLGMPVGPLAASPLRKKLGATINDVLIAALALTAAQWIEEREEQPPGRVSVTMPINARPPEWSREIVRNLVVGDQVSTTPDDREDPERCLAAVAGWTEAVKARGPATLLTALGSRPPGKASTRKFVTKWAYRFGASMADTLVLSNLGRLPEGWSDPEQLPVKGLWFSPPAAMPQGLGIGAATVDDQLCLTFRHHWALWSSEATASFAARLEDQLAELAR